MFHFRLRSLNKPSHVKGNHLPKVKDDMYEDSTTTTPETNQQENVPPVVFHRRRTVSDQEQLTRARAMELCTMYEMSDDSDISLKKLAIPEKKKLPSLSESLISSQAAVLCAQHHQKTNERVLLKETQISDSLRFAVPSSRNDSKRGYKVDIPISPSETSTLAETPSPVTEDDSQVKTGCHYKFDLPNMC